MSPLTRWNAGIPTPLPTPSPAQLREAFLWSAQRTVAKTATVSLHGNVYTVDPALVGRKVELVFDPFDLSDIEVRHQQHSYGTAIAFHFGRHAHPKARPEIPTDPPPATGIDYLNLLATRREQALARGINFNALTEPAAPTTDDGQVA
jgi:putative transposase